MSRPGEKSRVLTRIDAGESLKVLDKKGRWYKVRANGRTGWVKRTSVSTRAARKDVSKTRRKPFVEGRSSRRGFSGSGPQDRVGADAVEEDDDEEFIDDERMAAADEEGFEDEDMGGDDEKIVVVAARTDLLAKPSSKSDAVLEVKPGSELYVIRESKSGAWLLVENEDGDAGWIRSSEVKGGGGGYAYAKMTKRAGARIGYTSMGSIFASDGQGGLANYSISSAAASLAVGGDVLYKYSDKYMLAGDATYIGTRSSPGIRYVDAQGQAVDIGFTHHELAVGASAGYNLNNQYGMVVYGRVGYHYGKFDINDVGDFTKNTAYLPSEILSGITVGAHVDAPMVMEKYAVHVGIDMIPTSFGSRVQTVGLEDGVPAGAFALWGIGRVSYQWKDDYTLQGAYRYGLQRTDWSGAVDGSMRPHNATEAARKDVTHTLMVGVGKDF